jgi:putative SOS response-associated peptidase YedK
MAGVGKCQIRKSRVENHEGGKYKYGMCGRFVLIASLADVIEEFGVADFAGSFTQRYNIAPGSEVAAVVREGMNRLAFMKWGLVPSWAKDPSIGTGMINARAETVGEKPSFRDSFRKRRCLIPASGYYEWRKSGGRKIPYYIHARSGKPFGFAGLYDTWVAPDGVPVRTCTIITTEAAETVRLIHDRMPLVIPTHTMPQWLDPSLTDTKALIPLLAGPPEEYLEAYEVSTLVNSPKNDSPRLIVPANPG